METPRIHIGTDIAYESGRGGTKWPTDRFVAAVNGAWLTRKDGGIRKFKTRAAARKAALESIKSSAQT